MHGYVQIRAYEPMVRDSGLDCDPETGGQACLRTLGQGEGTVMGIDRQSSREFYGSSEQRGLRIKPCNR